MLIGIHLTLLVLRKTVGLALFLFATIAQLFAWTVIELVNLVATERTTWHNRMLAEGVSHAYRLLVYNPKR
jgi:hypothetical protein